jgi:SAM-dependent MidA family methyltransferase
VPRSDADGPTGDAAVEIRAAIAASDQESIGFDRFMELALYAEHGFYQHHRAGRRGDFITSVEVGPLFGAVMARFIAQCWEHAGRPDRFGVVEVGAGPGTLARSVMLALGDEVRDRIDYVAVEISETQRDQHPDTVVSVGSFAEAVDHLGGRIGAGLVVANELLDNLPFRLAVHDGVWREAFVIDRGDGTFAEVLSAPFDPVPAVLPTPADHGARAPLLDRARRWVDDARAAVEVGAVVVFDYAVATTTELAGRPYREWLRTYRAHERGEHPLRAPGSQDITCEIPVDQLREPDAIRTQSQWLQLHGIDELVAEGREYWDQHAAHPDLAAMRMRSRISEAEALMDPAGLGSFSVLEWRVG